MLLFVAQLCRFDGGLARTYDCTSYRSAPPGAQCCGMTAVFAGVGAALGVSLVSLCVVGVLLVVLVRAVVSRGMGVEPTSSCKLRSRFSTVWVTRRQQWLETFSPLAAV